MSGHSDSAPVDWQEFRRQMPITRRWAYFDHAAVAPLSGPAREAMCRWTQQASEDGDTVWGQWSEQAEETRRRAASLINAQPEEMALIPNTTAGISLVAEGFPWKPGDNVVVPDNEFPSNVYPWLNLASRGVTTRRVPVDGAEVCLDRMDRACDDRTRIISCSWVGYATGWRVDVDRLVDRAHRRGVLVFLDAIQGLGVFPLDVQRTPIDFLAADGHKWLLGPEGAGVFFTRREHLDRLRPIGVGWNSVVQRHDFTRIALNPRPEAARYEGGSQNLVGMAGLGASLQLLSRFGAAPAHSAIGQRILEMTDRCCERLQRIGARIASDRSPANRSGIVSFTMPDADPAAVRTRCRDENVALSERDGRLRISPHAYTDEEDIDRLVDAVARSVPTARGAGGHHSPPPRG